MEMFSRHLEKHYFKKVSIRSCFITIISLFLLVSVIEIDILTHAERENFYSKYTSILNITGIYITEKVWL